jgi:hypothetical protein
MSYLILPPFRDPVYYGRLLPASVFGIACGCAGDVALRLGVSP